MSDPNAPLGWHNPLEQGLKSKSLTKTVSTVHVYHVITQVQPGTSGQQQNTLYTDLDCRWCCLIPE